MEVVAEYRFRKIDRIDNGEGLNSEGVWKALDLQTQAEIAVKEIKKSDFPTADKYFAEAKAMFASSHPNVVPILTASQTKDCVCLGMPLMGGSLAGKIEVNPLKPKDLRALAQQVLAGLGAIHAANTIHFDIKPSNILFSNKGLSLIHI